MTKPDTEGTTLAKTTRDALRKELGREPTHAEIGRELNLPASAIDYLILRRVLRVVRQ